MGIAENNIMKGVMIAASKLNCRLYRNNVGLGWVGKSKLLTTGERVIYNARPLHAGLRTGSHDNIGFVTVKITPEMVGKEIAIFLGVESKTPIGRESEEQIAFGNIVKSRGGISITCRSEDDFTGALTKALDALKK